MCASANQGSFACIVELRPGFQLLEMFQGRNDSRTTSCSAAFGPALPDTSVALNSIPRLSEVKQRLTPVTAELAHQIVAFIATA